MTYFKSVLVGLLSTVIAIILWLFAVIAYFSVVSKTAISVVSEPASNAAVGWDVGSYANTYHLWAFCLLAFIVGFVWEFRRARRRIVHT